MSTAPQMSPGPARLPALDGLRGVAALVVVVFHYLCLLHWQATPIFGQNPPAAADTPLGLLWNGPFAVSVFFVLSGFVMAAAAERRRRTPFTNAITRYLRLAIPVTASILLAWALLYVLPDAATRLAASQVAPSPWLEFTYREVIPGPHIALADGLAGNFLRGRSGFNNVLWTMQIELLGSVMLFAIYWLASGRQRLLVLAGAAAVIIVAAPLHYLGFIVGAAIYEAAQRGRLDNMPAGVGVLAFVAGAALGAPGPGAHARLGLPEAPVALTLGNPDGFWPVLAAALILFAALTFRSLARALALRIPRWLGRVSFGLYLLHVPPLYTIVAAAHLSGALPGPVLAAAYFGAVLLAAHLFTLAVDEPCLRGLTRLRNKVPSVFRGQRAHNSADTPRPEAERHVG